jgi:hypothetical protein
MHASSAVAKSSFLKIAVRGTNKSNGAAFEVLYPSWKQTESLNGGAPATPRSGSLNRFLCGLNKIAPWFMVCM